MTFIEFYKKYANKGIDFDGAYGFQCMDLAHQYAVEVNGKDIPSAPAAKDVWDRVAKGYIKIPNSPTAVPQQGDIVIWGSTIGAYGHIAIFDYGDINQFVSFDQNWPVNSLCHLQNHSYKGVLGWLRLEKPVVTPTPTTTTNNAILNDQTKYDFGGDIGTQELGAVRSIINDTRRDLKSCKSQTPITLANSSFPELVKELLRRLKLG